MTLKKRSGGKLEGLPSAHPKKLEGKGMLAEIQLLV